MTLSTAFTVLYGGLLFAGGGVSVFLLAHRAASSLTSSAGLSSRLAATGVMGIAVIVTAAQALSLFGLYTPEGAALTLLVTAVSARRFFGANNALWIDARAAWRWARAVARSPAAPLLASAAAAIAAITWRGLSQPPLSWDSLTYHLPFAAAYVKEGSLVTLIGPLSMDHYAHFPKNAEIVASWLLLPFHGDLVVGVMNVGLLLLGWLSTHALARCLGVGSGDAALAALAVCTSPMLFSFATTQSADILAFVLSMAVLTFLLRFLSHGAPADALLVFVAAGLAIGTKYTTIPIALIAMAIVCASALRRVSGAPQPHGLRLFAAGVLLIGILGGRQYLSNLAATGNPVYPIDVQVAGVQLIAGSPYNAWLAADLGPGDRSLEWFQARQMFNYYPDWDDEVPTSAGPKYALLVLVAAFAAYFGGGTAVTAVRLVVGVALVTFVAAQTSGGYPEVLRRFWAGSSSRYLAPVWGATAVAAMSVTSWRPSWLGRILRGVLIAFIAWDLAVADLGEHVHLAGVLGLAVVALLGLVSVPVGSRRGVGRALAAAAVLVGIVGLPMLHAHRLSMRWKDFEQAKEIDEAPREFVHGWRYADQTSGRTIALVTGSDLHGQNRFAYPLMGSRLQNTVTYVPVNASQRPGSRGFILRDQPRADDWLAGIEQRGIEWVAAQSPWPVEDGWMRDRPGRFRPLFADEAMRIYEVVAARTRSGAG